MHTLVLPTHPTHPPTHPPQATDHPRQHQRPHLGGRFSYSPTHPPTPLHRQRTIHDNINDPNRPTWEDYKKAKADKLDLVR